ncbi:TonB-dependent receptor [Mucilaginibacter myungsuensis]|uniref:TonB-dependent receptor n=1 Tax=Mucilaginibacter myungsuensis TaxID=649104 RepID=UPI0025B5915D|nr:TonB-dependent receptor [Mucilaginibacter myungsuensis]MDN3599899.1 TonB-dependent receptor [Mucilaginibacter myungsuensis]
MGKITGKISDGKTAEVLIGATVLIDGTAKGAAANIDGVYSLANVAPGHYSITVKYIGYTSKQISDVEVKAGAATTLNVVLDAVPAKTLNTVTVKGTYKQESVNSLYAQQKNSAAVTDGITSESIKRSPDKSASEVLRRVSGATVQDNKFVVIRGLSDRYNNASLDGSALPSTEPNRKAFSFDIVPANLIDNMIISKTATPNLAGDFAGGSVQIVTKDIPDENFVTLNIGYGYNTNTTFKIFQSGYRNTTDYLAFDNGSRQLSRYFPSKATIDAGMSQARQNVALNRFNPDLTVRDNNAFLNTNYQVSVGRVKDFKNNNRLGVIAALTYRNQMQNINDGKVFYHQYNYDDLKYKFSTSVGALANFAYSYGKNRITFKNIYNRNFDDMYMYRTGTNVATGYLNKFYAFDLIQKGLFKTTVQGDHSFGERNSKLTWNASYANIINNQPDQRKLNYSYTNGDYYADLNTAGRQNARYFANLNENIYGGQVDYNLPLTVLKEKATFKTGFSTQYRDRKFVPRFIGMVINPAVPGAEELRTRPINEIFGTDFINQNFYNLQDITLPDDPYVANSLTNAGYVMLDNALSKKARLVWGVRVEKFDLDLTTSANNKAKLDNLDILPSANFIYSVTPKANLRLSYSRTVARPELRELAPSTYYDYELLATVQGNLNLKRTQIHNADIRYEFYPSAGQIISVSGFYKNFSNAIESYFDDKLSTPNITYFNTAKANNFGVEFEFRKTLDFISPKLKNTTWYTNLAIVKSEVEDPQLTLSEPGGKRPMVGQAPYVINGGIMQTAFNNRVSVNLLYNRVGERIFRAGGSMFPSVYENARDVVDLQLGLRAFKSRGEFKLNATDLLNQQTKFFFKNPKDTYNQATYGDVYNRYRLGQSISLSFAYNFK